MAENTKLILRSTELYDATKNYKVRPGLVDGPLFPSLTISDKTDANRLIPITYGGLSKSVSQHNHQPVFDAINSYRIEDPDYTSVLSTEDTTLEYIPEHLDIVEMIENLERMVTEYPQKLSMLTYLVSNLFDEGYAVDMYNVGRGTDITSNLSGGKFQSVPGEFTISGYIKAEYASSSISMNFVIRGVPVPMRRTLTSANDGGTFNYIFTYPQYAIRTEDSVNSIQHIEVSGQGSDPNLRFFKGSGTDPKYGFLVESQVTDDTDYANLQIYNKEDRNEY